jgi:hypothetical protein
LQKSCSYTTTRADNEHLIVWLYLCNPMQHLVSNQIVQNKYHGFRRVQACRNVNKLFFAKENVLGMAPEFRQSSDAVTHGDVGDTFARWSLWATYRIHHTKDGITRHKGCICQKRSVANPNGNVILAHGRG